MTVAPTVERECPQCGSAAASTQDYCLECGSRLPLDRGAATFPRRWLAPGDPAWGLLATGMVALVSMAAILAVQLARGDSHRLLVATAPQAAVIPPTEAEAATESVPVATPKPSATATRKPKARRAGQPIAWPAGTDGWTVVLASVPTGPGNRPVAMHQARQAVGRGLSKVGVLVSNAFSSLHPGYLVIFAGVYTSKADADQALSRAHAVGYQAAYAREITR